MLFTYLSKVQQGMEFHQILQQQDSHKPIHDKNDNKNVPIKTDLDLHYIYVYRLQIVPNIFVRHLFVQIYRGKKTYYKIFRIVHFRSGIVIVKVFLQTLYKYLFIDSV